MKNNPVQLECISINNYGKGVSKNIDGSIVFIDDFYPLEIADVVITKKEKNFSFGRIERLIKPSPYRIDRVCDHGNSGTCPFNDISYDEELRIKKQMVKSNIERALKREIDDFEIYGSPVIDGYRNKVTVFFERRNDMVSFGTFKEGTNEFVKINSCVQIQKSFMDILHVICDLIKKYDIEVLDRKRNTGYLKGVMIRRSEYTHETTIMFLSKKNQNKLKDIASNLMEEFNDIKGVSISVSSNDDTFIYSGDEIILRGTNKIREKLGDVIFEIDNQSFLQVNTIQASALYKKAIEMAELKSSDIILDLYSGCGGISLNASRFVKKAYGVETVRPAVENARRNALLNGIGNVEYLCSDALNFNDLIKNENIDCVFTDPPRSGMDHKVIDYLLNGDYKKIVYVSCDSYTMSRDLKLLSEKYDILKVCAYDQFPRTKHVETVCLLERKKDR